MAGQSLLQHLVIGRGRRRHQRHAVRAQGVEAGDEVVADQRDMLNALAIVGAQIFLDLPAAGLAFLVQRDADLAIGRGHRAAGEPRILALDVEIADLAEIEDTLVKSRPMRHPARVDIVRQMIDGVEPRAHRVPVHPRRIDEIDVVDAGGIAVPVDQIDERAADPAQRGDAQLHHPGACLHRLRPARDRFLVGGGRVLHAERHAAGGWPMFGREIGGVAARLVVGDQVDAALPPQLDVLRPVPRDAGETHALEYRLQHAPFGRAELDELEPVEAQRIVEQIGHEHAPEIFVPRKIGDRPRKIEAGVSRRV